MSFMMEQVRIEYTYNLSWLNLLAMVQPLTTKMWNIVPKEQRRVV